MFYTSLQLYIFAITSQNVQEKYCISQILKYASENAFTVV